MWFIYALPIFLVVTKLLRPVPVWAVWLAAAALEASDLHTGWVLIDEFAARYVYFFSGYVFAPYVFRFAEQVSAKTGLAIAGLVLWSLVNAAAVAAGISTAPVVSIALCLAGGLAVVSISVLLTRLSWTDALRYVGQHSLVVYVAFFLPMAATRVLLLRFGVIDDLGTMSAAVTLAGVAVPLVFHLLVRNTGARFLFERPGWARLRPASVRLAPAEEATSRAPNNRAPGNRRHVAPGPVG